MKAENVLKQAILLEERGKTFYTHVAEMSKNEGVRTLFLTMAGEEAKHVAFLSEQFKAYASAQSFIKMNDEEKPENLLSAVLTKDIKKQISAAGFEAAAISAAMAMEKNAIALYASRAEEAESENEKHLYTWLSEWEKTHLDILVSLDRELTENVWYDNSFWPF